MPLGNIDNIDRLGQEMLALQDELDTLMDERGLSDEDMQNLKGPIDQISIDALLSEESAGDAFLKVVEELRKAVALLKIDGPAN